MALLDDKQTEKILEVAQPLLKEWKYELVELKLRRQGKTLYVSLIVDRPTGGIMMDEVALINRNIGQLIEDGQFIAEHYIVEVASPGVDRPLVTANDFNRNIGRKVKFYLRLPVHNKVEHCGIIKEALDNRVVIESKAITLEIMYDNINKALQHIE